MYYSAFLMVFQLWPEQEVWRSRRRRRREGGVENRGEGGEREAKTKSFGSNLRPNWPKSKTQNVLFTHLLSWFASLIKVVQSVFVHIKLCLPEACFLCFLLPLMLFCGIACISMLHAAYPRSSSVRVRHRSQLRLGVIIVLVLVAQETPQWIQCISGWSQSSPVTRRGVAYETRQS